VDSPREYTLTLSLLILFFIHYVANEVKGTENVIIIAGEEKENNAIFLFLWTGRFAQATIGSVFIRFFK
jgi:hypothetical protein